MMQQTIYKRRNPCFAILKYRYLRYHHFKHGCYLRDPAFKKKKKKIDSWAKENKKHWFKHLHTYASNLYKWFQNTDLCGQILKSKNWFVSLCYWVFISWFTLWKLVLSHFVSLTYSRWNTVLGPLLSQSHPLRTNYRQNYFKIIPFR